MESAARPSHQGLTPLAIVCRPSGVDPVGIRWICLLATPTISCGLAHPPSSSLWTLPQSFAALYCHVIFSTKNREPFISGELQPRLYPYIGGVVRQEGSTLLAVGGMPDHVHLLVSLTRQSFIAEVVRLVKTNSSGWVHGTFPEPRGFAWQTGYGAFSVSTSNLPAVEHYIAAQEEHDRTRTFQEEFVEFLRRHSIAYDERYLWE